MNDSAIGQLAVLVFLLLASFLGRWLSRRERARQWAEQVESDVDTDTRRAGFSAVEPRSEAPLEWDPAVPEGVAAPATALLLDSEPSRAKPRASQHRSRDARPQARHERPRAIVMQPDLRYAFKLALLLAPPRALALEDEHDRDRIRP
jgi:hypothetical protein